MLVFQIVLSCFLSLPFGWSRYPRLTWTILNFFLYLFRHWISINSGKTDAWMAYGYPTFCNIGINNIFLGTVGHCLSIAPSSLGMDSQIWVAFLWHCSCLQRRNGWVKIFFNCSCRFLIPNHFFLFESFDYHLMSLSFAFLTTWIFCYFSIGSCIVLFFIKVGQKFFGSSITIFLSLLGTLIAVHFLNFISFDF